MVRKSFWIVQYTHVSIFVVVPLPGAWVSSNKPSACTATLPLIILNKKVRRIARPPHEPPAILSRGGGTQVHHGRVGSAGLCDLKILHPWRRLKKGVKILQWPPPKFPNARKGGSIFYTSMKSLQKRGQKSTILKNIGVKILQVWKWGSKFYMLKNRGQNSTMLEKRGVNILHPTPKVEVKIQKGRAYPLPKI